MPVTNAHPLLLATGREHCPPRKKCWTEVAFTHKLYEYRDDFQTAVIFIVETKWGRNQDAST